MKMATCRLYVCTVGMHKKEPQKPQEHTSEHVKSQFSGDVPPDPPCSVYYQPYFLYLTWAPPILSAALLTTRRRNTLPKDIKTVGQLIFIKYCRLVLEFFQKLFVLLFGTAKRQCIALQDSDATLLCFCVNCDSPRNASLVATI